MRCGNELGYVMEIKIGGTVAYLSLPLQAMWIWFFGISIVWRWPNYSVSKMRKTRTS